MSHVSSSVNLLVPMSCKHCAHAAAQLLGFLARFCTSDKMHGMQSAFVFSIPAPFLHGPPVLCPPVNLIPMSAPRQGYWVYVYSVEHTIVPNSPSIYTMLTWRAAIRHHEEGWWQHRIHAIAEEGWQRYRFMVVPVGPDDSE